MTEERFKNIPESFDSKHYKIGKDVMKHSDDIGGDFEEQFGQTLASTA